jgi:hypothetical protein
MQVMDVESNTLVRLGDACGGVFRQGRLITSAACSTGCGRCSGCP